MKNRKLNFIFFAAVVAWLSHCFLTSHEAFLVMAGLIVLASLGFWVSAIGLRNKVSREPNVVVNGVSVHLLWAGLGVGGAGEMLRWRETLTFYGTFWYAPVSNLYEVLILLILILTLFIGWWHIKYGSALFSALLLLIVDVLIIYWVILCANYQIQRFSLLPPSLQSKWMLFHVCANFLGYGFFSLSSLVGLTFLIRDRLFRKPSCSHQLPSSKTLANAMKSSIRWGIVFFTLATILGAVWANQAWGAFWSWDPKETWALIVWLNYVTWLHYAMISPTKLRQQAWWAFISLLILTIAFLGVNFYFGGLHSYGGF